MVNGVERGTTVLVLLVFISIMTMGLLAALPVMQTQMQRELEEELIFRGLQYVEAIRVFQAKNPGAFPKDLEELFKKRYLRRLFRDPMTKDGRWNLILQQGAGMRMAPPARREGRTGADRGGAPAGSGGPGGGVQLLLVPEASLSSIQNPQIIGVASSSPRKSFRIYEENETYDAWLFYVGHDPSQKPEVVRFGEKTKRP